jgi:hypothetical protein
VRAPARNIAGVTMLESATASTLSRTAGASGLQSHRAKGYTAGALKDTLNRFAIENLHSKASFTLERVRTPECQIARLVVLSFRHLRIPRGIRQAAVYPSSVSRSLFSTTISYSHCIQLHCSSKGHYCVGYVATSNPPLGSNT